MMNERENAPRTKKKRKKRAPKLQKVDTILLFVTLAILSFGLIMVLSAGSVQGYERTNNTFYYARQQLKWVLIGIIPMIAAIKVRYTFLRKFAGIAFIVSIFFLLMVLFSDAGITAKGSARWMNLGPISFQPSELAKLGIILFYAHLLDRYPVRSIRDLILPAGLLLPVLALIYKQPDLGTTMVIGLTFAAMLLQTELATIWFVGSIPIIGSVLFYLVRHMDYQWKRILVWWNPWAYAANEGYQITNAQIAFGSGGLFGVGLGRSLQKYGFLPENYTDMIFAIIGEELGLWGTTLLIGLFLVFFARGYYISRNCPDRFGRLLGFGLTSTLAIQTITNLAVVTGVFPVTGITLPLISYGGSSLLVTMIEIGLLLNISRHQKQPVILNRSSNNLPA